MSIKKDIVSRVTLVYVAALILALLIIGKILYLQIFERAKYEEIAVKTYKEIKLEAKRGDIRSSEGKLLASSVPYFEIRMDLHKTVIPDSIFYDNVDSLASCMALLYPDSVKNKLYYKEYLLKARKKQSRYQFIRKNVTYAELKQMKTFPIFNRGRYKGGLIHERTDTRFNPNFELARRTIGRTKKEYEKRNLIGIEGAYDYYLKGIDGARKMQRLSGGDWLPVGDNHTIDPKDGKDVITTFDVIIQDVAENALRKQLEIENADHGSVIVMEVKTGEIKAIANLQRDKDSVYRELYNFAIGEKSEPGSTFKLPALIAALEDGLFDLYDTVDIGNGVKKYKDFTIKDSEKPERSRITMKEAFEKSSNVGVSNIIEQCYGNNPEKFIDRLYSMNLNKKLNIEIKGEEEPNIKYPDDPFWSGVSLAQMSIGYELELTPIHTLTFYNAIANNGVMLKPLFVKAISDHDKIVKTFKAEVLHASICSQETIEKAKKMMEGVVEHGTASRLNKANYKIAGKTGTAQIADEDKGYKKKGSKAKYLASFVGYFPADNPLYSCIVTVSNPTGWAYYASSIAVPVFGEIADKIYTTNIKYPQEFKVEQPYLDVHVPYTKNGKKNELDYVLNQLNIPSQYFGNLKSDWVVTTKEKDYVLYQNRSIKERIVPNVKEMGAKDAVYILESLGLKVILDGVGGVTSQSIKAGSRAIEGKEIILKLGS